jgi:tetratricopeptide (TPR) repeat protein
MYEWFDGDPAWLGRAIEMNQKALSIDPESTEAQFGIAMVYFHQKRLAEARRVLEKIVEQKSDFYDAHLRLGMLSEVAGDIDAALRHYERSAEIKPYNEEAWMYLDGAWRRKGDAQSSDRAARKLIEVASRKLEVTPDDIITLSRLAVSYARYGGKEEAHFALKRVLEIDPNDGLALYSCACTYAMLGESQEALACLRNAIANGWKGVPELARSNPDLDSLRKDPEFGVVLAESHRRSYSS